MDIQFDVSIIIVNYFTFDYLRNCINSIIEFSKDFSYEIIVVDNSCDNTESLKLNSIVSNKVKIKILKPNNNLGFGKANNYGAKEAESKYLYFLNPDTLLIDNSIFQLKKYLDDHDDVSIAGSDILDSKQKPYHSFFRNEYNVKNIKKDNSLLSYIRRKIFKQRNDFNYLNKVIDIQGYVCGASLFIRRKDFDFVGGFDKDIFLYAEESLLCKTVKDKTGMKIVNIPSSKIVHLEGGSFKTKLSLNRLERSLEGNTIYFKKGFGCEETSKYWKFMRRFYLKKAFWYFLLLRFSNSKIYIEAFHFAKHLNNSFKKTR